MIQTFIQTFFHFLQSLGLGGVFLSMFIENIAIPFPTELGYLLGQDLINTKKYSFEVILIITTLGHVFGSIVSYWVGRIGDSYVRRKLKTEGKLKKTHIVVTSWYDKYGVITVFITRFVGYVRPWSSLVAGFASVSFWPFLFWTALGSLIFNIIALYFTGILMLVWRRFENLHFVIVLVMLVLFFGFIIYQSLRSSFSAKRKKGTEV